MSVSAIAQTDEEKLVATVKAFHQTLVNKNIISINQQTDKALTYGHSNGWVESKTEMLQNLETGYLKYNSFIEDSIHVSMNKNLASVRFIATIDVDLNGKNGIYFLKVLEVWQKKGNRWVLFARQAVKEIKN
ncbi:MAG: nuclear transport factor 2 family protein [Chitinophagaceae bacterium]|nr:nuclear transport factor 2 family protein [Chitinophagaceae bacterium]